MSDKFYFVQLAKRDLRFRVYSKDLEKFLTYLTYTKKTKFQLNVFTPDLKHDKIILDYYNRYSDRYFKSLYARLIKFNERYVSDKLSKNQNIHVFMITLTIPQKNKSIYQCLEDLRTYRKDLFQFLRNQRKKNTSIDWLWFTEPHKSGYPHTHIMVLCDSVNFSQNKTKLKKLWHNITGANFYHGLDFEYIGEVVSSLSSCLDSDNKTSDSITNINGEVLAVSAGAVAVGAASACADSDSKTSDCITNIVQYIIKYMSKSLMSSVDLSTLIFHSQVAKFYHPIPQYPGTGSGAYRLWGYSAGLSPYLQKTKKEQKEGYNILSFGYAGEDSKIFYRTYNDALFFSILQRYSDENLIKTKVIED